MADENTTLTTPDTLDVKDEPTTVQEEQVENESVEEDSGSKNDIVDKIWNDENLDIEELSELSKTKSPMTNQDKASTPSSEQETEPQETVANEGLNIPNPVLKFKGRELKIDNPEEMIALAQKGLLLELEQGKIKPHKKTIKLIEDNGLTQEDIVALADAKNGKKEAIDYLSNKFGIIAEKDDNDFTSVFDDEPKQSNTDYKPNIEETNPVQEWFEEYSANNKEGGAKVVDTINNIDDSFFAELYNPNVFPVFVQHVEQGIFDKAYPKAVTLKATNPTLNWITAYNNAINAVFGSQKEQKKEPPADAQIPKSTKTTSSTKKVEDADKVWDDDEYYEQLKQRLGFN